MSKALECLKRIDEKNYLTEREHREFLDVVKKELEAKSQRMTLKELLGILEMQTTIDLYYSNSPRWDVKTEKLLMKDTNIFRILNVLNEEDKNAQVIGIKIDVKTFDNIVLHICISKNLQEEM